MMTSFLNTSTARKPDAVLAMLVAFVGHGHSTPEEVQAFRSLQASAYHCAPAVAAYTAERKRNWAQRVLGSVPLSMKQYFVDSAFKNDHADDDANGKQIIACKPIKVAKIKNSTCVLSPETTEGPYYHAEGHPMRSNMAENELGLLFLMNVGVIDVETCEPVPDVLVDLWHANSTGFYAGESLSMCFVRFLTTRSWGSVFSSSLSLH